MAPMTMVEPTYFDETVGRLRDRGHDVRHFSLLADRSTVLRRLQNRGFGPAAKRPESFAVSRLDPYLERLRAPLFAEQLWTDHLTIPEVAERIAASAGLRLTRNTDSAALAPLRRMWAGLQQIRWK